MQLSALFIFMYIAECRSFLSNDSLAYNCFSTCIWIQRLLWQRLNTWSHLCLVVLKQKYQESLRIISYQDNTKIMAYRIRVKICFLERRAFSFFQWSYCQTVVTVLIISPCFHWYIKCFSLFILLYTWNWAILSVLILFSWVSANTREAFVTYLPLLLYKATVRLPERQ